MTVTRGRGGWTRWGMPDNNRDGVGDTRYYDFELGTYKVGQSGAGYPGTWKGDTVWIDGNQDAFDDFAVNRGVMQIQERINRLGFWPALKVDGILSLVTDFALGWAQGVKLGVKVDGVAGPTTCVRLFWPAVRAQTFYVLTDNKVAPYGEKIARWVAGIAQHESNWDPGAVGFGTPQDLGLMQINGAYNPTITADDRFNYKLAFQYAAKRLDTDLHRSGYTDRLAICRYGYPSTAERWLAQGNENPPPRTPDETDEEYAAIVEFNTHIVEFVDQVLAWVPPS